MGFAKGRRAVWRRIAALTAVAPSCATIRRRGLGLAIITVLTACTCAIAEAQRSFRSLHAGFLHPPPASRPMMRWWWFGPAVTKDELARELLQMHEAGIGGVEIQPVYPLSVDDPSRGIKNLRYLSPAFLDAVRFANGKAASLGMRVDITLGSGWPYGGPGTSLAEAAGCLRVIALPISAGAIIPPPLAEGESLIASFRVDGTPASYAAASAQTLDLHMPSGGVHSGGPQTALSFVASHTRQTVKRPAFGAEGLVLDHFSRAAIDAHLHTVAAPLLSAFGTRPPSSVFSDSLEVYSSDWTTNLLPEFKRRRGYDLTAHLPELAHGGTAQATAVRRDWGLTLAELVDENYLEPIRDFALAHDTRFRSQTYGEPAVRLADEATAALPEGEGPQWRSFSFTRWAASASHLYGRNITSAETWTWLHSPAFRATPLDMKVEADRMFLQGVNQIVGHGWPYSPRTLGEPGWSLYAAAVFNAHNPWWPVMPDVVRYLHRASWLLRQGKPANDIAILLPEDDAEGAFSPGHVSVTDEMKRRVTPELMGAILDAGYNVDFIDPATIDRIGIPYPILLLPPTQSLPLRTARVIRAYAANRGSVVAVGSLPALAPGLRGEADTSELAVMIAAIFHGPGAVLVPSTATLADALHHALPPDFSATNLPHTGGDATAGLGFLHRRVPDGDVYFVVNSSNQPLSTSVQFRAKHAALEQWSLDSGEIVSRGGAGAFRLELAAYESTVFVLRPGGRETKAPEKAIRSSASDLKASWSITFPGAPAEPLDSFGSWTTFTGRRNFSGEAVYRARLSLPASTGKNEVLLDFGEGTAMTDTRPADAPGLHANLDPPVREAAIVTVNGRRAGSLWHPPYRIDIGTFLHAGDNQVEVHVFNTAINDLAGQPPRDYERLEAAFGRRFVPQDMDHLEPVPSGLLHPVTIHLAERPAARTGKGAHP